MADGEYLQTSVEADAATKDIFDFFGLPRELRNEVYSLLTANLCLCSGYDDELTAFEVRVAAAPLPELFTLCRQFRVEYEEQFTHGLTATFKDLGREIYTSENVICGRLDRITKAEILLLTICEGNACSDDSCGTYADLSDHIDWIEVVVPKFPNLKEVAVKIYNCQSAYHVDASNHNSIMDDILCRLKPLPLTTRIEVYPFYVLQEYSGAVHGIKACEEKQAPEMVWTKDLGWQKEGNGGGVDS
jgi:hypothetical protein